MTTSTPTSLRPAALAVALVFAPGCGDATGTTASGTQGSSSSTDSTSTTTDGGPTTSTTGTTGGMTESSSGTSTGSSSDPTTGTTTTTGVSATDSTGTGTTGTTTGTSSTTDTGDPPKSCLDADFPVKAPLCGDGGPACVTLHDELVSAKKAFRNDMPAIALRGDCGPAVLFSEAVGGYFGFHAERTGPDAWLVESTPMTVATGSLEADPAADALVAVVDDGTYGVSLWRRAGGQWAQESALAGQNHARAPQLVRDAQGALHLGHVDADSNALHEVYDGAWSKEQVLTGADIHVRLALDAAAAPRLTAWSSKNATWELHFMAPPAVSEVVTPLGSNTLERAHTGLALVGADATPWALLARKQPDQLHHDILLAHRTGKDAWTLETLAAEDPVADKTCDGEPGQQGQVCMYDYVRLHPLVLLASADELRALYLAIRHQGTMVADCQPMPFPMCFWVPQSDSSTSELRVAWPGSQPDEHQVAAVDVFTDRATGRLDSAGEIHLAFYDYPPAGGDPVVRYMHIGP